MLRRSGESAFGSRTVQKVGSTKSHITIQKTSLHPLCVKLLSPLRERDSILR
jgi:hypothetical protein